MSRSFLLAASVVLAVTVAGCFGAAHQQPQKPPEVTVRTATLDLTPGIKVLARNTLPDGFVPLADYPPMWLQGGKEIGVVGVRSQRTVIVGFSGPGWRDARVIAEDGGPGLRDGGIMDIAPSPDGMALALAVANSKEKRIDLVVRDLIATGEGGAHSAANFEGSFESARVGWLDRLTIGLALRASQRAPALQPTSVDGKTIAISSPGLYVIGIKGTVTEEWVNLGCPLSRLSWAPDGRYAVGEGDAVAPPVLIDRNGPSCRPLNGNRPIHVLDWSPDGKSFLYAGQGQTGETAAYRYDLATGTARLVAVASDAAMFTASGNVLALGSSRLTLQQVESMPNTPARAELAFLDAKQQQTAIVSLGFDTTPAMLSASTMAYSRASHSAAIATFGATPAGLSRKIIVFRLADGNAFLVAFGPARGPVLTSWSPKGQYLAIADGDAAASTLTVLEPPR